MCAVVRGQPNRNTKRATVLHHRCGFDRGLDWSGRSDVERGMAGGAEESTVEGQTLRRQVAISQVTRITLTTAQKSPILADNSFIMIFSF